MLIEVLKILFIYLSIWLFVCLFWSNFILQCLYNSICRQFLPRGLSGVLRPSSGVAHLLHPALLSASFFPPFFSLPPQLTEETLAWAPARTTNPSKPKCTGANRTPGEEASSFSRSTRKQTRRRRGENVKIRGDFFSPFLSFCRGVGLASQQKPGKMASTRTLLALALLGIFLLLDVSVKGEVQRQQQEEEERSCQGAFDLYFVLDKWVSDIIYGFVLLSPRCALPCNRPVFFWRRTERHFLSPSNIRFCESLPRDSSQSGNSLYMRFSLFRLSLFEV